MSAAEASIARTTETCLVVPAWLAVASAACSPRRATPEFMTASAWKGFRLERGKIGESGEPCLAISEPSGARTTAEPTCLDSTKPLRSTTASSTASLAAKVPDVDMVHPSPPAQRRRQSSLSAAPRARLRRAGLLGARPPCDTGTMLGEHHYAVDVEWHGDLGTGTSGYRDYSRDVELRSAAAAPIHGSADKPFRGDPDRWNPEQLLLGALAQCHLLSYLHVAVTVGVVVTAYSDAATGTMREDGASGGAFTEVLLRPVVTVASADMVDAAMAAHARANELCFIARSVNFPVRHEPTILIADR